MFFLNAEEQTSGINEYSERASHDENAIRLLIAAALLEEIRLAIFEQTTFRCSAGISHNKVILILVFIERLEISRNF